MDNKFASLDAVLREKKEYEMLTSELAVEERVQKDGARILANILQAFQDGHIKGFMVNTILTKEARDHAETCGFGEIVCVASDTHHLLSHVLSSTRQAADIVELPFGLMVLREIAASQNEEEEPESDDSISHVSH